MSCLSWMSCAFASASLAARRAFLVLRAISRSDTPEVLDSVTTRSARACASCSRKEACMSLQSGIERASATPSSAACTAAPALPAWVCAWTIVGTILASRSRSPIDAKSFRALSQACSASPGSGARSAPQARWISAWVPQQLASPAFSPIRWKMLRASLIAFIDMSTSWTVGNLWLPYSSDNRIITMPSRMASPVRLQSSRWACATSAAAAISSREAKLLRLWSNASSSLTTLLFACLAPGFSPRGLVRG
mmetsp:Transcript_53773/g.166508  ORF Transcript_53773/g.166508 Transcript_53773/m.166508 type:complete len:250 (+) Transcript_53773:313-1062(+)